MKVKYIIISYFKEKALFVCENNLLKPEVQLKFFQSIWEKLFVVVASPQRSLGKITRTLPRIFPLESLCV